MIDIWIYFFNLKCILKSAHLGNQSCILKDIAGAQLEVGTIVVICTYKTKKINKDGYFMSDVIETIRNKKKDWSDMSSVDSICHKKYCSLSY